MDLKAGRHESESRFTAYVEALSSALGHDDRAVPFHSYCMGLLLPGDRESVEPMAARVQPGRVLVAHQSLHHFVAKPIGRMIRCWQRCGRGFCLWLRSAVQSGP